jgi:hypothetical protein
MDSEPARRAQLEPLLHLPRVGLEELLRGWSGNGSIYAALAAIQGSPYEVHWTERDIRRRAGRVLLGRMEAVILRLPATAQEWQEYLPVSTESRKRISRTPVRPTNWVQTSRRFGWPPSQFIGNPRARVLDESALTALVWTANALDTLTRDTRALGSALVDRLAPQVTALVEVSRSRLEDVTAIRPDRLDLMSLGASGRPWSALAAVASEIARAETDLEFLAFEVIEPDPELAWRLFHLSALGAVLIALKADRGSIRWLAPLAASQVSGPQFQATMPDGLKWDVWFEAGGAELYYGVESLYRRSTAAVARNDRSMGADIMLVRPSERALIFECKWSAHGPYVGRDGFHQAASYALQARAELVQSVWSYVVGPSEVVPETSSSLLAWDQTSVVLGTTNIDSIGLLVDRFLRNERDPVLSEAVGFSGA